MIESTVTFRELLADRRPRRGGGLASLHGQTAVLLLFLVLNGLDILTTLIGLRSGGREANPVGVWVMQYGEHMLYISKAFSMVLAWAVVAWKPRVVMGIWVGNFILTLIVVNNLFEIWG